VGEQPPWNPYGQQEPNQWQGQPPYPSQQPYGQQQPYPGRPPYGRTPDGQPYQQGQPYGQQTRPNSGHRRRAPQKSRPRRHKILTAVGALVALIIISAIASAASGRNQASPSAPAATGTSAAPSAAASATRKAIHSAVPSATSSPTRRASQTAADACDNRPDASGDIYVRMIQPGISPQAQELGGEWRWDYTTNKCLTSVQLMITTAPHTPGTCTQVGYVADNPGYNVNAASAPALRDVVAQAGPAC
jgi:hypothetical protein